MSCERDKKKIIVRTYGLIRDLVNWSQKIFCIDREVSLEEFLERDIPDIRSIMREKSQEIIIVVNRIVIPINRLGEVVLNRESEIDLLPTLVGGQSATHVSSYKNGSSQGPV